MNLKLPLDKPGQRARRLQVLPNSSGDPLDDEQAGKLLPVVDIIRDPLHGDIHLTKLERRIIESANFQRLQNIYQLAMTYVAYPSAIHNRFIHSLGTLHVCVQMVTTCNRNADLYSRLGPAEDPKPVRIHNYTVLLARTCALLHDMAHVPFGHTFEKEAQIFELDEWQDPDRAMLLLGDKSEIAQIIRDVFKAELGVEAPAPADQFRQEILQVLKTKRKNVQLLPYPFIHDLVGNTICADLIDYVQRDMYFAGLTERFGTRFLEYLAVFPLEGTQPGEVKKDWQGFKVVPRGEIQTWNAFRTQGERRCRVVLMQYRYNERENAVEKPGVFEEAIDLVRRRYSVAEKLYFHRTKVAASAMLAEAAYEAKLDVETIWDKTDAEVIKHMQNLGDRPRAVEIANKLRARRIFKPIYQIGHHVDDESAAAIEVKKVVERFQKPSERSAIAQQIERIIRLQLPPDKATHAVGSCVISCPHGDMNIKQFEMLVLRRPDQMVRMLNDSAHPPTKMEIEAIKQRHYDLWQLTVLISPMVIDFSRTTDLFTRELAGAIQHEIGPPNGLLAFKGIAPRGKLSDLESKLTVRRGIQDLGVDPLDITERHLSQLEELNFRSETPEARSEAIHNFLVSNSYLKSNDGTSAAKVPG